jgi:hypothetical protein
MLGPGLQVDPTVGLRVSGKQKLGAFQWRRLGRALGQGWLIVR